jgi:hypothetical protein
MATLQQLSGMYKTSIKNNSLLSICKDCFINIRDVQAGMAGFLP